MHAVASSYPLWFILLFRFLVVAPLVPGIVVMILGLIRGRQGMSQFFGGLFVLLVGVPVSVFLYRGSFLK